jgi:hypothetical protein
VLVFGWQEEVGVKSRRPWRRMGSDGRAKVEGLLGADVAGRDVLAET